MKLVVAIGRALIALGGLAAGVVVLVQVLGALDILPAWATNPLGLFRATHSWALAGRTTDGRFIASSVAGGEHPCFGTTGRGQGPPSLKLAGLPKEKAGIVQCEHDDDEDLTYAFRFDLTHHDHARLEKFSGT